MKNAFIQDLRSKMQHSNTRIDLIGLMIDEIKFMKLKEGIRISNLDAVKTLREDFEDAANSKLQTDISDVMKMFGM